MSYTVRFRNASFNLKSITVEPVMFLYMYTTFTQLLTFQSLIYDKVCQSHFNSTVCNNLTDVSNKAEEELVQKEASTWILYISLCLGIPSLVTVTLFLGPWGDRAGRKIPIIFPLIGNFLFCINNILNSIYISAPISFLLIGNTISGLTGGFIGMLMALYSYIAHIATSENRTVKMGILEAMIFLSGTLGTGTSGLMLDSTSYTFVFSELCVVLFLAFIYTLVWVDNVKAEGPANRGTSTFHSCFLTVKDTCLCVYNKRRSPNLGKIVVFLIIMTLLMLCTVGENDILLLYTKNPPLSWSQTTVGLYKGSETFIRGVAVITLLPLLKFKLRARDTTLAMIGFVSKMVQLFLIGIGKSTTVLFIASVSGVVQGFSSAGVRSICSVLVAKDEQAKMFGVIGTLESVATIAATSLFNTVYRETLDFYAGFPFFMAAGIILICLILTLGLHLRMKGEVVERYDTLTEPEVTDDGELRGGDGLQVQTYIDQEEEGAE